MDFLSLVSPKRRAGRGGRPRLHRQRRGACRASGGQAGRAAGNVWTAGRQGRTRPLPSAGRHPHERPGRDAADAMRRRGRGRRSGDPRGVGRRPRTGSSRCDWQPAGLTAVGARSGPVGAVCPTSEVRSRRHAQLRQAALTNDKSKIAGQRHSQRPGQAADLVSQKILSIWAMRSSSSWPVAGSIEDFAPSAPPPAFLVALLNSSCSSGYFSKCGGLK
jgi:hypothetical protein